MLHSKQVWFKAAIVFGCILAVLLLLQSIAGYFYISRRLEGDQLDRDGDRLAVRLEREARQRGLIDPTTLAQIMNRLVEEEAAEQQQRIAWLRVLDPSGRVLAEGGSPVGPPPNREALRRLLEERARIRRIQNVPLGKIFVNVVPLHIPVRSPDLHAEGERRPGPRLLEIGLYEGNASRGFGILRANLLVSSAASLMLLGSMFLLAYKLRGYLLGKQSERELEVARRVQHDLLPALAPLYGDLECAGVCIPARQVGGDFYDVFTTEAGTTALIVGDVAGKGLGAALVMSLLHGAIRCSNWMGNLAHEAATQAINAVLFSSTAIETFATLFWAYYDAPTLYYVNAGHWPPILLRYSVGGNVRVEHLTESGLVVGALPQATYRQGTVHIEPGDLLVLYSDGVLEAEDLSGDQFGEDRLLSTIKEHSDLPCTQICGQIVNRVRAFTQIKSLQDDLTVVLVRVTMKTPVKRQQSPN
jgi:hypothetical protein